MQTIRSWNKSIYSTRSSTNWVCLTNLDVRVVCLFCLTARRRDGAESARGFIGKFAMLIKQILIVFIWLDSFECTLLFIDPSIIDLVVEQSI